MPRHIVQMGRLLILVHIFLGVASYSQASQAARSKAPCPQQGEPEGTPRIFVEQQPLGECNSSARVYPSKGGLEHLHCCVAENALPKDVLVTGGAGFVGSHLVDRLMLDGHRVTVLDDFSTGRMSNVQHWQGHKNFKLLEQDVASFSPAPSAAPTYDQIYHLAAPASPVRYMANPIKTINTIVLGAMNILSLAGRSNRTRVVLASTSEIYGDPLVHPQREDYWGNTNPIGPRSCYDESKRLSESLASAHARQHNAPIAIARIFNTYGPRMDPKDGRVISNFVAQAIQNRPLTVYGTGNQTRSFQYISDLVSGLKALMDGNLNGPFNLGNPHEITISMLARQVKQVVAESTSEVVFSQLPVDDPSRRRPDISKAMEGLTWKPHVELGEGLARTVEYFRQELAR